MKEIIRSTLHGVIRSLSTLESYLKARGYDDESIKYAIESRNESELKPVQHYMANVKFDDGSELYYDIGANTYPDMYEFDEDAESPKPLFSVDDRVYIDAVNGPMGLTTGTVLYKA